jgi:hypothetical protein
MRENLKERNQTHSTTVIKKREVINILIYLNLKESASHMVHIDNFNDTVWQVNVSPCHAIV